MAELQTYRVIRTMDGDRRYEAGDTRELDPNDARHLVALGALVPVDTKVEAAPANKAATAPANKSVKRK